MFWAEVGSYTHEPNLVSSFVNEVLLEEAHPFGYLLSMATFAL